jgi:hypothetical protein
VQAKLVRTAFGGAPPRLTTAGARRSSLPCLAPARGHKTAHQKGHARRLATHGLRLKRADLLAKPLAGWEFEIADALKVKGLAPLACKTDRIDAWVLAELSRRELVPVIYGYPTRAVRAERERARWRLPPMHQLPRDVWRYRVARLEVADLTTAARLARVDLSSPMPGRRSWPPYQEVGEALWRQGWRGIVAPSAARPDGVVLCLFVVDFATLPAEPVPPPRVAAEPPVPPTGMRT